MQESMNQNIHWIHYKTQQTLDFWDKHRTSDGFTRARLRARLSAFQAPILEISEVGLPRERRSCVHDVGGTTGGTTDVIRC